MVNVKIFQGASNTLLNLLFLKVKTDNTALYCQF